MNEKDKINFNLIKAIKKTNNQFLKLENEVVRKYNLTTSQYGVLECLYMKGDMCINDLITRLISTSGTMTVIVKNLEKLGYITKTLDCDDKRSFKVVLTKQGRELVEKILPERKEVLDDFASTLNEQEIEDLLRILYKFKNRYKGKKDE